MRNAARRSYVLGVLGALLGAFALVVMADAGTPNNSYAPGAGDGRGDLALPTAAFTISGDVTQPLAPGVRAPINLQIKNPHGFRLRVATVQVSLLRVIAPRADRAHPCTVRDFVVKQVPNTREKMRIAADDTRTLRSLDLRRAKWPRVGMINRPVNQDGCKGAALILSYTGSGNWGQR